MTCQNVSVEPSEEDQWSWWQRGQEPTAPNYAVPTTGSTAATPGVDRTGLLTDPDPVSPSDPATGLEGQPEADRDPIRMALIGLVGTLTVVLAAVSFARFGPDGSTEAAVLTTTTVTESSTTTPEPTTTTPPAETTASTTTEATTTTVVTTSTSTPSAPGVAPSPPSNVEIVSTSSTGAEIRWESDECVGSRYQVADFEAGSGGWPEVNRCWFNHVILAGDPAFSPPLSPNTSYTVTIQAVAEDGTVSDPVQVQFTTTS